MANFKAYLASGWFSPEQESARRFLIDHLQSNGLDFFSPKDDNLGPSDAGLSLQARVLKGNCDAIRESNLVVASLVGFDMGTTWEIGFAVANRIPVIIYAKLETLVKVEAKMTVLQYAHDGTTLDAAIRAITEPYSTFCAIL